MALSAIGEFGLIDRIREILGPSPPEVITGPGDDAAVFRPAAGRDILLTTDALTEGIHFDLSYTPLNALGWKSLAASISDIAAMGGRPLYAAVALALPASWSPAGVELLVSGMKECGDAFGCAVIGGDVTGSAGGAFISVALTGDTAAGAAVTRGGAVPGDLICVTGSPGRARTGLEVLRSGADAARYPASVSRFLKPVPRAAEAASLIMQNRISSMIDISDGLGSELRHLCRAGGTGCLVRTDMLPVCSEVAGWAECRGVDSSDYIMNSGEEYELLFTLRGSRVCRDFEFPEITVIGEIRPAQEGLMMIRGGRRVPLKGAGWDHFSG